MEANTYTTYTTVQGDAWDSIAYKLFGNEYFMQEILAANPSLADVLIFSADITINIPSISRKITPINPVPWA